MIVHSTFAYLPMQNHIGRTQPPYTKPHYRKRSKIAHVPMHHVTAAHKIAIMCINVWLVQSSKVDNYACTLLDCLPACLSVYRGRTGLLYTRIAPI